jgi:hypothetical protein
MKSLTGGLIFRHRAEFGGLPGLTIVMARPVAPGEPASIAAGASDLDLCLDDYTFEMALSRRS